MVLIVRASSRRDRIFASSAVNGSLVLIQCGNPLATLELCLRPSCGRGLRMSRSNCRSIIARWGSVNETRSRRRRTIALTMATAWWKISFEVCVSCSMEVFSVLESKDQMPPKSDSLAAAGLYGVNNLLWVRKLLMSHTSGKSFRQKAQGTDCHCRWEGCS